MSGSCKLASHIVLKRLDEPICLGVNKKLKHVLRPNIQVRAVLVHMLHFDFFVMVNCCTTGAITTLDYIELRSSCFVADRKLERYSISDNVTGFKNSPSSVWLLFNVKHAFWIITFFATANIIC